MASGYKVLSSAVSSHVVKSIFHNFFRIPVDFKKYHGEFDTGILTLPHEKICEIIKWPFEEV